MTRVEFACRRILLGYLIEMIERPGFRRLPPAHFWNRNNERRYISSNSLRWAPRDFGYARRKWMLDPQIEQAPLHQPLPMRMPAKAYVHRDGLGPLDQRTMLTAQIMDSIRETGGDTCAVERRLSGHYEAGHSYCVCGLIEGHNTRHKCEHGYW